MENKKRYIAVICLNSDDFLMWKHNIISIPNSSSYGYKTIFKDNDTNTYYHAVSNIRDLCSLAIDDYMETPYAKHKEDYDEIVEQCKRNLKTINNGNGGLYNKYNITKTNGKPIDPNAEYFVLRLDEGCNDKKHLDACRKAATTYAIEMRDHKPELVEDMMYVYNLPYIPNEMEMNDVINKMQRYDVVDEIREDIVEIFNKCRIKIDKYDNCIEYVDYHNDTIPFIFIRGDNISFTINMYIVIEYKKKYDLTYDEIIDILIYIFEDIFNLKDIEIETHI